MSRCVRALRMGGLGVFLYFLLAFEEWTGGDFCAYDMGKVYRVTCPTAFGDHYSLSSRGGIVAYLP